MLLYDLIGLYSVDIRIIITTMEYELYLYCTGMGTLIIVLILLYHLLGNDDKANHQQLPEAAAEQ